MQLGLRLQHVIYRAARLLFSLWNIAVLGGSATLLGLGYYPRIAARDSGIGPLLAVGLLGAVLIGQLANRLRGPRHASLISRFRKPGEASFARDLEFGATLLTVLYVCIAFFGGLTSPIQPLTYVLLAFLVTFHRAMVGVALTAFALTLEFLLYYGTVGRLSDVTALELLCSHVIFLSFAALAHLVFLQIEMMRQRREHRLSIQREIRVLREEARDFRLISSSLSADPNVRSRAVDEERLAIGAVETIHQALFYTLELLKKSLDLHTCVLLWLDESGSLLKIKELVTDSDAITDVVIPADAGAIGTIVKNRLLLNLRDPKRSHLPYYATPERIKSFLGVPVLEDGHLRGVVCADRDDDRPFTANDETLLLGAAQQILRAIQSERVFAAVERAKYEHERFFGALSRLNRALTAEQVCTTTFEATKEICDFDFAAITLFHRETKKHTVIATTGDAPSGLAGLQFSDNAGLASMVVKNKHFLPAAGEMRDRDAVIYTKKFRLNGMESLLIVPLICADEAIGSFTIASRRTRSFGKDKREMLGVIANHVAVALMNANMYGKMEQMATTDGLTGLHNHRTFQERFADMLARAERSSGKLALLLTDVDHFKKVNDTYGHPVGDQVLRGVAQVVRDCVRKVDLAARYGGEEFAVVLEGTDLKGARLLAERIRKEVEKQQFQSATGTFSVTLSIGIAVYSMDGKDVKTLIDHSDKALYHCKRTGRNRAAAFSDIGDQKAA